MDDLSENLKPPSTEDSKVCPQSATSLGSFDRTQTPRKLVGAAANQRLIQDSRGNDRKGKRQAALGWEGSERRSEGMRRGCASQAPIPSRLCALPS